MSSDSDLEAIAAAASSLADRRSGAPLPAAETTDERSVTRRLEAWREAAAKGDDELFRRRLARDGLDEEMARGLLAGARWPRGRQLPAWGNLLREVLTAAGGRQRARRHLFLQAAEPEPFEEILTPFVLVARRRLAARAGKAYDRLTPDAHAGLERSLLQALTYVSAPALNLEFSLLRASEQSTVTGILSEALNLTERSLYERFVGRMLGGGLVGFFREYAVLARLLSTVTSSRVEAYAEFLVRLETDAGEIERIFCPGRPTGRVATVRPGLSDPHRGGRSVIEVGFESGLRLVYKPKDLGTDVVYWRLLSWLNARHPPLEFKVLRLLNRSTHGWVEFVAPRPCRDGGEAADYFVRSGMLLCLLYVLEATDCHMENVIACGGHPVLVDTETLLHHRPRMPEDGAGLLASKMANEQIGGSVLRVGLLPVWEVGKDRRVAFNLGGLGQGGEQPTSFRVARWSRVNTDQMRLDYGAATITADAHVPTCDGAPVELGPHVGEVVDGFREMYRFLMRRRDDLGRPGGPLSAFAEQRVRFIYRATRVYGALHNELLNPEFLREGVDRSLHLEHLARDRVRGEEEPVFWRVLEHEVRAMEGADIPYFTAVAGNDALELGEGETLEGCFREPSFERVLGKVRRLDENDLGRQLHFVRGALYSYGAGGQSTAERPARRVRHGVESAAVATDDELRSTALKLAAELRDRAVLGADGSAVWIAPVYQTEAGRYQFQTTGFNLYDGAGGIALFLAAVAAVCGDSSCRDLALATLSPIREALREEAARAELGDGVRIGGAVGLGAIVYAFARVGPLLEEPSLVDDAERAARLISESAIRADDTLDVNLGAAGAALGLLALYEATRDPALLRQVRQCGTHLLRSRRASRSGTRAWPTVDDKLLTGMSHGAAGIAYALARIYGATARTEYLAAAEEGIAYERSVFRSDVQNWPDLLAEEEPGVRFSWCHGAPGIALARLGCLSAIDDDDIRGEIEVALRTTLATSSADVDHLCCGNVGRAAVLSQAARVLGRPELDEQARRRISWVLERARRNGGFLMQPGLPTEVYCPGFFQGTAGIGYELLRLTAPDRLPCALMWL